ncbi:hypothetical protein CURTO8I2_170176 [Curtobacterium sp. 8I-2]|nr:hypothetical protein CURTO8I2_170176 [Curtobacterium sp. 8I-2]
MGRRRGVRRDPRAARARRRGLHAVPGVLPRGRVARRRPDECEQGLEPRRHEVRDDDRRLGAGPRVVRRPADRGRRAHRHPRLHGERRGLQRGRTVAGVTAHRARGEPAHPGRADRRRAARRRVPAAAGVVPGVARPAGAAVGRRSRSGARRPGEGGARLRPGVRTAGPGLRATELRLLGGDPRRGTQPPGRSRPRLNPSCVDRRVAAARRRRVRSTPCNRRDAAGFGGVSTLRRRRGKTPACEWREGRSAYSNRCQAGLFAYV